MRRTIPVLLLVTVAILLLMVAPAFAKTGTKSGGYWPYSAGAGEFLFEIHNGPAYIYASPEMSPHSGLATSTGQCKVCHAVHGAGMQTATGGLATEKLLRSTAADACVFCHLTGGSFAFDPYNTPVTIQGEPYGTAPTFWGQLVGTVTNSVQNYNSNDSSPFGNAAYPRSGHSKTHGHDNPQSSTGLPKSYKGCVSCHAVHDANTIAGGTFLLKNDPARGTTDNDTTGWGVGGLGYGSKYAPVTNQVAFCEDCHDGTKLVGPMVSGDAATKVTPIISQDDFNLYFPSCGANGNTGARCHNSVQQFTTAAGADGITESIAQFGAFKTPSHNGRSHIMTTTMDAWVADPTDVVDGKHFIASNASTTPDGDGYAAATNGCIACHDVPAYDEALGNAQGATFPHFSPGQELIPDFNMIGAPDAVCRDCHEGVGTKF